MKKALLIAAVLVSLLYPTAKATEFTIDNVVYSVSDYTHATVLGLSDKNATAVTIPYTVNYTIDGSQYMFFVTRIAENAFADTKLAQLTFAAPISPSAASQGALVIENGAFATPTLKEVIVDRPHVPVVNGQPFTDETLSDGTLSFGPDISAEEEQAWLSQAPWNQFGSGVPTGIPALKPNQKQSRSIHPPGTRSLQARPRPSRPKQASTSSAPGATPQKY